MGERSFLLKADIIYFFCGSKSGLQTSKYFSIDCHVWSWLHFFSLFCMFILCNNPFKPNAQICYFLLFAVLFHFFVTILCQFDAIIPFLSFNQIEDSLFLDKSRKTNFMSESFFLCTSDRRPKIFLFEFFSFITVLNIFCFSNADNKIVSDVEHWTCKCNFCFTFSTKHKIERKFDFNPVLTTIEP